MEWNKWTTCIPHHFPLLHHWKILHIFQGTLFDRNSLFPPSRPQLHHLWRKSSMQKGWKREREREGGLTISLHIKEMFINHVNMYSSKVLWALEFQIWTKRLCELENQHDITQLSHGILWAMTKLSNILSNFKEKKEKIGYGLF